jgi:acetyl esterase/lipase
MFVNISPLLRSVLLLALLLSAPRASAEEKTFMKKTYTIWSGDGVELKADVYRADDNKVRPVVVWLHGGALIVGSRTAVPQRLLELCRTEGFALVSLDYRLAPEVKIPAILADVQKGFGWIREQGAKECHFDVNRIVATGGSAGGYLAMMTGVHVTPKPKAIVAYWGYGDVDGDWYTKPSEHYRKTVPLIEKEEAYKGVGKKVLSGTEVKDEEKARGLFYRYLRQNGLWTREVTGFDPVKERTKLDPYCPVRNITRDFPPILMVHGTTDTDVPYEKSAEMAKELAKQKVVHELVTVEGAGHGLSGGDKKKVDEANEKALAFIRKYLTDSN